MISAAANALYVVKAVFFQNFDAVFFKSFSGRMGRILSFFSGENKETAGVDASTKTGKKRCC